MKRDIYELKDRFGNKTRLTVPAGDHTNHLLTRGENKILTVIKNVDERK